MWQTTKQPSVKIRPRLKDLGIDGEMVIAWVVIDTAGRAELATLDFEYSPDRAFKAAVRAYLAEARYTPAEIGPGCRVRMWSRMGFDFRR